MQEPTISFDRVDSDDIEKLQKISIETFEKAFGSKNKASNMFSYINQAFQLDQLKKELSNPHSALYFAKRGDEIIGYLKMNIHDAQTEDVHPDALEIQRIYLLPRCTGQGIGKLMMKFMEHKAIELNLSLIWLGVWEHNPEAIKFYQSHGYVHFDSHDFPFGDEVQTDFLLKKAL